MWLSKSSLLVVAPLDLSCLNSFTSTHPWWTSSSDLYSLAFPPLKKMDVKGEGRVWESLEKSPGKPRQRLTRKVWRDSRKSYKGDDTSTTPAYNHYNHYNIIIFCQFNLNKKYGIWSEVLWKSHMNEVKWTHKVSWHWSVTHNVLTSLSYTSVEGTHLHLL